ncbi:MAG: hypothetical protein K8F25_09615 [Fimbriimonadaceae bacterium]|nr:hypothetical protein [Alphaproteobacteria bacterium]
MATIHGSFRGVEDETTYIWIRRFDDEQHRQKLYEAVYESEVWKNELSPKVGQLIDRKAAIVRQLFATAQSQIQ